MTFSYQPGIIPSTTYQRLYGSRDDMEKDMY